VGDFNNPLSNKRAQINEIETKKNHTNNKMKSWFIENMNNIGKPLANLTKINREKTQISKIRTKKRGDRNTKKSRELSGTTYFENLHLNEL
jgi:hypothetical protein